MRKRSCSNYPAPVRLNYLKNASQGDRFSFRGCPWIVRISSGKCKRHRFDSIGRMWLLTMSTTVLWSPVVLAFNRELQEFQESTASFDFSTEKGVVRTLMDINKYISWPADQDAAEIEILEEAFETGADFGAFPQDDNFPATWESGLP